mmetsp:Transcript_42982/g.111048  ORF Transcript_42982/g.111048 Transcript_42982/m.111048 type:complete len:228 (+) Transcript_42982:1187-1870(+)
MAVKDGIGLLQLGYILSVIYRRTPIWWMQASGRDGGFGVATEPHFRFEFSRCFIQAGQVFVKMLYMGKRRDEVGGTVTADCRIANVGCGFRPLSFLSFLTALWHSPHFEPDWRVSRYGGRDVGLVFLLFRACPPFSFFAQLRVHSQLLPLPISPFRIPRRCGRTPDMLQSKPLGCLARYAHILRCLHLHLSLFSSSSSSPLFRSRGRQLFLHSCEKPLRRVCTDWPS